MSFKKIYYESDSNYRIDPIPDKEYDGEFEDQYRSKVKIDFQNDKDVQNFLTEFENDINKYLSEWGNKATDISGEILAPRTLFVMQQVIKSAMESSLR